MRWQVTGSDGQLGRCLVDGLRADAGEDLVWAGDQADLDVADSAAVAGIFDVLDGGPPDVLVNAAAFTAVDRCETEAELAFDANALAPGLLAQRCREAGVLLVHVSTDYVFDGRASEPYGEGSPIRPRTAYGRSKAEGERRVLEVQPEALVVRTSWLFGPGRNFVEAILRQARLRCSGEVAGPLSVVDDQRGCPTYAGDLARGIRQLVALASRRDPADGREVRGVFHLCNRGAVSWWQFARAILDHAGHADLDIERLRTQDLELPAERPRYSVLDCSRAASLGVRLRPWEEALAAYLASREDVVPREGA